MQAKVTFFSSKKTLNLQGKLLDLTDPLVMGIVNNTPDSFYDGGQYTADEHLVVHLEHLAEAGADIIDIGGYSSRPGAVDISVQEEQSRVLQAIKAAQKVAPHIPISVDTFRSQVAEAAINAGASMINDISGGALDKNMYTVVAKSKVPYVLMHMKGNPQNMSQQANYEDLITEITEYFVSKVQLLQSLGVMDILIDPGFGFSKTSEQNYALLKNLNYFTSLKHPLLVGLSRKSMIFRNLDTTAQEALNGTSVLNTIALMNGASILRVHDVGTAKEVVKLFKLTYP